MNLKATLTFVVLVVAAKLHARVGETLEQVSDRYGTGQKQNCDRLPGGEKYYFVKKPYGIEVIVVNGKAVMEIFHRSEGPEISDGEIKELLKVNGDSHAWSFDKKDSHWMRSDRKMRAYRQPGHGDFFFIEDVEATKQARTKSSKDSINGF
jgi:hypothetical protein